MVPPAPSPRSSRRPRRLREARMPIDAGLLRDAKALGFSDRAIERLTGAARGIGPGAPPLACDHARTWPKSTRSPPSFRPRPTTSTPATARPRTTPRPRRGARSSCSAPALIESARASSSIGAPSMRSGPRRRSATKPSWSTTTPRRSAPTTTSATSWCSTKSASSRCSICANREHVDGVIVSMGGQIPNSLALQLHQAGIKVLGTHPENIDRAEDRSKFGALLDELGIDQPRWFHVTDAHGGDTPRSSASAATRCSCARATY